MTTLGAQRLGAPLFDNAPRAYDALLVLSFGGPEGMDDVMPFLENVTRGRNIPRERLEEVAEHYAHFGGVSPINAQNRALIAALERELADHGIDLPIYVGNRNWHPLLQDTIEAMRADAVRNFLLFVTSAYSSYSSCRQYREDVVRALDVMGLEEHEMRFDKIRVFYNHPGFVEPMAQRVRAALESLPRDRRDAAEIVFTAHSIPVEMAKGCAYERQLREVSRLVAGLSGITRYRLAWQSRSGPPNVPWLEPDILDELDNLHASGVKDVIVVPIGFISDHLEVLFDLDVEAQNRAHQLGMNMIRVVTVGTDPVFVAMIRELIEERLQENPERRFLGELGASHDVCAVNCCQLSDAALSRGPHRSRRPPERVLAPRRRSLGERQMESRLPVTQADAVVIGAGAFGLSAGYQLAAHGAGQVVVLDRFAPGSQTSPRAAGLYKLIQADETLTRLARSSIEVIRGFSEATGIPLSFVQSGSVLAARTAEHAALIDEEAEASAGWGVELEKIDAEGLHRIAPYLTGRDIQSAYFVPGDIYIEEPRSLLDAYMAAIAQLRSLVIGEAPVIGILAKDGEIAGVSTPRGDISTPLVIDAAGAWARGVGALAGVEVPVAPVRHQLLITRPIAGMSPQEPIARIVDASAYLRPARGGLMMGGMESDPMAIDPRLDPNFSMPDTPLDMRVLDDLTEALGPLVPALGDSPIAEHRGGLFTMTPDARFLAGPVPGVHGFWTATGCNGSGFSISAGIGRALAEWIVGGEPTIDLSSFDPGRFRTGLIDDDELTSAGLWQYANYYTPQLAS